MQSKVGEKAGTKVINDLFPFFIAVDSTMTIVEVGRGVLKIIPDLEVLENFSNYFSILLPSTQLSFESIATYIDEIFIISSLDGQFRFRGQMYFEEASNYLFFLGTPIISTPRDFAKLNLNVNDFAKYDVLPDYLLVLQAQNTSHEETERIARKLSIQSTKLKESNEELKRFSYVASHDLQTPLRSIISFSQLLNKRYSDLIDKEGQEFLMFIIDATKRMKALINDLLNYSRVHNKPLEFAKLEVSQTIEDVLKDLSADIQKRNALVTVQDMPTIYADGLQIYQLFQNLISNAIKFNKSKQPQVKISFQESFTNYTFSVADNGIGIPMDLTNKIFEVFQQLNRVEDYGGTGIGLTICKKVIDRHKGKIWIHSSPDEGSTFYFTISKSLDLKKNENK